MFQVTLEQESEAVAPPLEASQLLRASVLPLPSHSTVRSAATPSRVGAVVSSMVKVAVDVAVFPQSSVAVKVTVADPVAPHSSESEE